MTKHIKKYAVMFMSESTIVSSIGRIFDVTSSISNHQAAKNPSQVDARALSSDWSLVGGDIRLAMEKYQDGTTS